MEDRPNVVTEYPPPVVPWSRSRVGSESNYSSYSNSADIAKIMPEKLPKGSDIFQKVLEDMMPKPELPTKADHKPKPGIMSKSTRDKQKASFRAVACSIRFKKILQMSRAQNGTAKV